MNQIMTHPLKNERNWNIVHKLFVFTQILAYTSLFIYLNSGESGVNGNISYIITGVGICNGIIGIFLLFEPKNRMKGKTYQWQIICAILIMLLIIIMWLLSLVFWLIFFH